MTRRWRPAVFVAAWLVLVLVCLLVWSLAIVGAASVLDW